MGETVSNKTQKSNECIGKYTSHMDPMGVFEQQNPCFSPSTHDDSHDCSRDAPATVM